MEDEVELSTCRVPVLEIHRASDVPVLAGPPNDREGAVAQVVERPFNDDLTCRQERRPRALPGLADDDADAGTLVAGDFVRVRAVEDVVGEREDVAGRVTRAVGDRVRGRTLDDAN